MRTPCISTHIRNHGCTAWWRVSEQFPEVSRRTISRLARRTEASDPEPELAETVTEVRRAVDRPACPAQTEPHASSEVPRSMNLLDKYHTVWAESERQLAHCLNEQGEIRNVNLHHKTVTLRGRLVNVSHRLAANPSLTLPSPRSC